MHFEDAVIAAAGLGDKVRFIYVHLYYTSISKQNQHDACLSVPLGNCNGYGVTNWVSMLLETSVIVGLCLYCR
jgi:hypothetical protein